SWCQLSPLWWFLPVLLGVGYFLGVRPFTRMAAVRWVLLGIALLNVSVGSGRQQLTNGSARERFWSPYYCIDYAPAPARSIRVNLIGHKEMVARDSPTAPGYAYALPHLLNRDAHEPGAPAPAPFEDVLVIGAGSGNDVSRALAWGARHVDAVEIDPVIQRLG